MNQQLGVPKNGEYSLQISFLIGCGIVAAAQIGKAVISVQMIRKEMAIGLDVAGLIVATFATMGALLGIFAGAVVRRLGTRRALICGLAAISAGNVMGAVAPNEQMLLIARIIEGVGFLGVILAVPSLLSALEIGRKRDFVLALWSAYMPVGITLMLALGPFLPLIGWRNLWFASAIVTGVLAVLVKFLAPRSIRGIVVFRATLFSDAAAVLRDRTCLLLAFAFFAFSCQIFSMAFALPFLLTAAGGLSLGTAGLLSAGVMTVSSIGHIASGFLLRAGVPIWLNITAAFVAFAAASTFIYWSSLPPSGVAVVAALTLGLGGLAPGALYAAAPRVAPSPGCVPTTIGLLQQASSLGQFAGPIAVGAWAQHEGWVAVPWLTAPAALFGLTACIVLRHTMSRRTQPARPDYAAAAARSP